LHPERKNKVENEAETKSVNQSDTKNYAKRTGKEQACRWYRDMEKKGGRKAKDLSAIREKNKTPSRTPPPIDASERRPEGVKLSEHENGVPEGIRQTLLLR